MTAVLEPSRLQRALAAALSEVHQIQAILARERPFAPVPSERACTSAAHINASSSTTLVGAAKHPQPVLDRCSAGCQTEADDQLSFDGLFDSPGPSPVQPTRAPLPSDTLKPQLSMFSNDLFHSDSEADVRDQDQGLGPLVPQAVQSAQAAAAGPFSQPVPAVTEAPELSVTPLPLPASGLLLSTASGSVVPHMGLDLFAAHMGEEEQGDEDGGEPLRMPLRSFEDALAGCSTPLAAHASMASMFSNTASRPASLPQQQARLPEHQARLPEAALALLPASTPPQAQQENVPPAPLVALLTPISAFAQKENIPGATQPPLAGSAQGRRSAGKIPMPLSASNHNTPGSGSKHQGLTPLAVGVPSADKSCDKGAATKGDRSTPASAARGKAVGAKGKPGVKGNTAAPLASVARRHQMHGWMAP